MWLIASYCTEEKNLLYSFICCFRQNYLRTYLFLEFVKIGNSGIENWEFVKLCGEKLKYLNLFSKIRAHYWCSRTAVECWCCNLLKSRNSYRIKIRKKSERWFLAIIRITHQTMGWNLFWSCFFLRSFWWAKEIEKNGTSLLIFKSHEITRENINAVVMK